MNTNFDAVIIDNGDYPKNEIPQEIIRKATFTICCDGAADNFLLKGNIPNVIIGDGDSISEQNKIKYNDIYITIPDQETNDQTKAFNYCVELKKNNIAIVGATGKREDHTLGNIFLLAEYLEKANVTMFTDYGYFFPVNKNVEFETKVGIQLSIFNIDAKNLSAKGLMYPLRGFDALWQGTLNRATENKIKINSDGRYIVFVSYK